MVHVLETTFLPMGSVVVFLLFGLLTAVLWLWGLVDALKIPDDRWAAAGQSKLLWVLVIVFLGLLGAVLYAVIARPTLTRQRA